MNQKRYLRGFNVFILLKLLSENAVKKLAVSQVRNQNFTSCYWITIGGIASDNCHHSFTQCKWSKTKLIFVCTFPPRMCSFCGSSKPQFFCVLFTSFFSECQSYVNLCTKLVLRFLFLLQSLLLNSFDLSFVCQHCLIRFVIRLRLPFCLHQLFLFDFSSYTNFNISFSDNHVERK